MMKKVKILNKDRIRITDFSFFVLGSYVPLHHHWSSLFIFYCLEAKASTPHSLHPSWALLYPHIKPKPKLPFMLNLAFQSMIY